MPITMGATALTGRLRAATARMDHVLDGLKAASPDVLDGCAGLIELACQELAGVSGGSDGPGGEPAALAAALQLRTRVRQARRLLDNVYRFHSRWGQMLGARTGGYLAGGQAAPVPSASRLFLRG
jgi:hypothetical protein